MDLGLEEMLHGDGVTVIEWADKLLPLLPARTIHVHLDGLGDEPREITIDEPVSDPAALIPPRPRATACAWARRAAASGEWPAEDRPRERLYHKGAESLADAELLAIQLGTGLAGCSAMDMARDLLRRYGSLSGLAGRGIAELAAVRGVGPVKAVRLAAAFEITRRLRSRNGPGAGGAGRAPSRCSRATGR